MLFTLQQAAMHGAAFALIGASATFGTLYMAERAGWQFERRGRRTGRAGLMMGIGLVAACIGSKVGAQCAIEAIEADYQRQRAGGADERS